jgi:hypothetical protein
VWGQRLVVVAAIALVVAIVVDALHSSTNNSPAPSRTAVTAAGVDLGVRFCARRDMRIAVEIRRPSHHQHTHLLREEPVIDVLPAKSSGSLQAHSRQQVATVILRNVSGRRCLGGSPFSITITDRVGETVSEWLDSTWFVAYYRPGGYRTFSLPAVYRCDRPGPFTAVAAVGLYTARRHGLSLSEITCA